MLEDERRLSDQCGSQSWPLGGAAVSHSYLAGNKSFPGGQLGVTAEPEAS